MKNRKLVRMMSLALAAALSFGTLFAGVSLADEGAAAEPAPIAESESSGKETSSKAEDKKDTSAETHEAIAESESSDKETDGRKTAGPAAKVSSIKKDSKTAGDPTTLVVVADEKADLNDTPIVEVQEKATVGSNSAQIAHNEGNVTGTVGEILLNDTTGKVKLESVDGGASGYVKYNLGVVTNATDGTMPVKVTSEDNGEASSAPAAEEEAAAPEAAGEAAAPAAEEEAAPAEETPQDNGDEAAEAEGNSDDGDQDTTDYPSLTTSDAFAKKVDIADLMDDDKLEQSKEAQSGEDILSLSQYRLNTVEEPIVQNTPLYYAEGGYTYVGIGYGRADTGNLPETEARMMLEKEAEDAAKAADEAAVAVGYESAEALKKDYTQTKTELAAAQAAYQKLQDDKTASQEELEAAKSNVETLQLKVDDFDAKIAMSGIGTAIMTAEETAIELEMNGMVIEQWNASEDTEGYTVRSYDELSSILGKAPKGKTFKYWKGSDGNKYKVGDTYTTIAGLRLEAVWKKIQEAAKKSSSSSIRVTTNEDNKSLTVRGAKQDRFIELSVDDEVISSDYYTLTTDENGRLQVVFTDEFLAGLLAGDHALYLRFTNGSSRSTLSI